MAATENEMWTVIIVAEDRKFNKTYEHSQDITLEQIMDTWMEECGQFGYWVFTSPDRQDRYFDFMTLEMVGETVLNSRIVTLRVKLLEELEPRRTSEIFGFVKDKCHCIDVEPEQRLFEVLRCLPGRPRELEHNGALLNLKETVVEAALKNNDVIQECGRQISVSVKLSSGETRIFQVTENSFVLHLFEKVKNYETEDFSLTHRGRYLHMQEKVRGLNQVVEVSMVQFAVDIYGQRISWTTRSEPTKYPRFISELSYHGHLEIEKLEDMEFSCIGCRRCISKSEDVQLLPIQCCRERSLTLSAKPHSNIKTLGDSQQVWASIKSLLENLRQGSETKSQAEASRELCRQLHESLKYSGLSYNDSMEFVEKMKKNIVKLKNAINELKKENDSLRVNISELEKESKILKATSVALEALTLKAINTDLETNAKAFQGVFRCLHENVGVKLLVRYDPREFSPVVSRPEIQQHGEYQWAVYSHVKCVIPDLQPGWTTFEAVRDVLQPLFADNAIRLIDQARSLVKGKDVARVTRLDDDELPEDRIENEYCDVDGRHVKMVEADKLPEVYEIRVGGRVFISGGQRRTVLNIWYWC